MSYPKEMVALMEQQTGRKWIGVFGNNLYQVEMMEYDSGVGIVYWLSIVRRDRSAIHDWRDLQRIKNELVGPDHEGMEIYPAEDRLVDTNNQYHLFVLPNPGDRIPVGYAQRDVGDRTEGTKHKQRPFETRPADMNAKDYSDLSMSVYGKAIGKRDDRSEDTTKVRDT
jgi:hypothetical protein